MHNQTNRGFGVEWTACVPAETHHVCLLLRLLLFLVRFALRRFYSLLAPAPSPQGKDCGVEVGEVLPPRVPPYLRRGLP